MADSSVKNREVEYISEPCEVIDLDALTEDMTATEANTYKSKNYALISSPNTHIHAARYGKIIMLTCDGDNVTPSGDSSASGYNSGAGWRTIAKLISAIRPAASYQPVYMAGVDNSAGTQASSTALNMRIRSNGEIQVYFFSDKSRLGPRFSVAYPSA